MISGVILRETSMACRVWAKLARVVTADVESALDSLLESRSMDLSVLVAWDRRDECRRLRATRAQQTCTSARRESSLEVGSSLLLEFSCQVVLKFQASRRRTVVLQAQP